MPFGAEGSRDVCCGWFKREAQRATIILGVKPYSDSCSHVSRLGGPSAERHIYIYIYIFGGHLRMGQLQAYRVGKDLTYLASPELQSRQ